MAELFLSYAHQDIGRAQTLAQLLEGRAAYFIRSRMSSRDYTVLLYQRRGAVVIEGRNAEDRISERLKQRIDKRRNRGALGQHHKPAEHDHHNDDRH